MEQMDHANNALVEPGKEEKNGSDNEQDVTSCGIGECRSERLQKLATIGVFTGVSSLPLLLTSTLSTYVNSQVTTLEKQFGLSSSQTGLLLSANDIGYVVIAVFVSYLAPKVHIPRFLAVCSAIFGVSGVICSLPHFLFGVERLEDRTTNNMTSLPINFIGQLCPKINESETCNFDDDGTNKPRTHATAALIIIGTGMFLQGATKAPRHPFTVTYLDDNVIKTKTGYYLGIIITMGIMGPVLSYALGGLFSRIYVTLEHTSLHPRHPKWVGAWWLGYIVFGVSSFVVSFPLMFFPRKLNGAPVKCITKEHQKMKSFTQEAKNYCRLMVKILSNSIYMCLLGSTIMVIFSVGGMHSFLPKYIENQFGLEAWKANLIMAGLSLSTACVGTFVGGWLSKKLKMGALLALKWNCCLYALVVIFFGLSMVFGCNQPEIINTPGISESACMSSCGCETDEYFPICGSDNANYYSPCHAGCTNHDAGRYTNCTCIPGGSATPGSCEYNCPFTIPYLIALGCSMFASTLAIIPKITAEIRCVSEEEKPLSIGVQTVMASLLGWMLSPIFFGKVIDTSCLIWDYDCDQRGACVLYDLADFRFKLHGLVLGTRFLSLVFALCALIIALVTKRIDPKNLVNEQKK